MKTLKLVMLALVFGGVLSACGGGEAAQNVEKEAPEQDTEALIEQEKFNRILASYEDPARERWQKPDVLVRLLGDLAGKTVADIGAGSGYFTFRLAEQAEKVLAIDIDQRFLDHIDSRKASESAANIETRLTTADKPGLALGEADVVLVVNTFHLVENKVEWLRQIHEGMKETSRMVLVDYKKHEYFPNGPAEELKLEPEEVEAMLLEAGFEAARFDVDQLKYQYIVKTKKGSFDKPAQS